MLAIAITVFLVHAGASAAAEVRSTELQAAEPKATELQVVEPQTAALQTAALQTAESESTEFRVDEGLTVLVIEAQGKSVAGATISLFTQSSGGLEECRDWRKAESVKLSGEDGRTDFGLSQAGVFCLHVQLDGFAPVRVGPFEIEPLVQPRTSVVTPVTVLLPATIQSSAVRLIEEGS